MKKLAIITTHPIQYYAPWFKLLAERKNIQIKVFYTWGEGVLQDKYDPGFGRSIQWDIPLLEGYDYSFEKNIAKDKGSHHFGGIVCPELIKNITAWSPDALLVIGWAYNAHLRVMRHFKGRKPILFRGDSTLLDEKEGFSVKKMLRWAFLKWVYKHVDIALYVGTNNRKYYKRFGLKDQQLVQAPHAIDNTRFVDATGKYESEASKWRNNLCIPENAVVFLFTGKFEQKKAPQLLLQAFLDVNCKNAHLIFVGSGILENELKDKAEKNPNIHFIEFQNQSMMPIVYRLGDVFVLPSEGPGETWGLAINESMASGRCIIASDKCGGAVDLISDEYGNIFPANDIDALERCISKWAQHTRKDLAILGNKAQVSVKEFNFERIVDAIENCVEGK